MDSEYKGLYYQEAERLQKMVRLWHRESERLKEIMRLYEQSLEMQFKILAALEESRIELEKEKSITLFQRLTYMCCLRLKTN